MDMKTVIKSIVLMCIIVMPLSAFSQERNYTIGGPQYNRQIYDSRKNQVTHFKQWELIRDFYVSPDNEKMAVYHRPDKSKCFLLTLYDLKTHTVISECEPGWACVGIRWMKDYLIYMWATSGGGTRFEYRNYNNLNVAFVLNSYGYYEDAEDDVLIFYPIYSASDSGVSVYEYSTGKKISGDFLSGKSGYTIRYIKIDEKIKPDINKIGFHQYEIGIVYRDDTEAKEMITF